MADYTTGMSGTAVLDDGIVLAYDQQYIIAAQQANIMDQFVTQKTNIGAKSITVTKYANTALATTALTDKEDPDSTAMSDSAVTLTPAEYGQVVTTTKLAELQNGNKIDTAPARIVGSNMGSTLDKLAILAGEGSANELTVDGGAESALTASDIMTVTFLNKLNNKLRRASIPMIGDQYIAIMHADVIHDLQNATGAGSFNDVSKYSDPSSALKNEIGSLGGFRIVEDNNVTINADAGDSAVDTYHTICLGFNGLAKVVSQNAGLVMGPAGDKLNRFFNVGWYGVLQYGILDQDALWLGTCASSVGANT